MSRLEDFLDPFRELTQDAYAKLFYARKRERDAEARFKTLITSYKALLQDKRYQLVVADMAQVLGRELTRLVEAGQRCTCVARCASLAERITLLQEIVGEPLQMVWVEEHRPKAEIDLSELAPINGAA